MNPTKEHLLKNKIILSAILLIAVAGIIFYIQCGSCSGNTSGICYKENSENCKKAICKKDSLKCEKHSEGICEKCEKGICKKDYSKCEKNSEGVCEKCEKGICKKGASKCEKNSEGVCEKCEKGICKKQQKVCHKNKENPHHNNKPHAKLTLNDGNKWAMDTHTKTVLQQMKNDFSSVVISENNTEALKASGKQQQGHIQRLIKGCTMKGAPHDQLHLLLEKLIPAINTLNESGSIASAKEVKTHLALYSAYFE